jgi:hypothetical protein
VAEQKRMRWYNPALGGFEWRDVPARDEEALSLLDGYPGADEDAAVYEQWRELGAGILTSLIRARRLKRRTKWRDLGPAGAVLLGLEARPHLGLWRRLPTASPRRGRASLCGC